jgi:hypothetical protein
MFVFKKYDRQNHVWSFMTKYLRFRCKFTSWSGETPTGNRICFSIQPQLQLVNLHRNWRYFVIKLHTWFCLSYFLKTNIKFYFIYQFVLREYILRVHILVSSEHKLCQTWNTCLLSCIYWSAHHTQSHNTARLKTGVYKLVERAKVGHGTWFCLWYFLKTNIKLYFIYQYFMSINSFFNTVSVARYSRPITVTRDPL